MNRPKALTDTHKRMLWSRLNEAIKFQLGVTPGEYDVISIIDGVSRDFVTQFDVSYNKACDYLETRYATEDDQS